MSSAHVNRVIVHCSEFVVHCVASFVGWKLLTLSIHIFDVLSMNDVLPTACAIRCICTTLSTECLVVLHGIATAILVHCVGAWMSFITEACDLRELVRCHAVDVFSRCHNHTMVLSDDLRLSCRREP